MYTLYMPKAKTEEEWRVMALKELDNQVRSAVRRQDLYLMRNLSYALSDARDGYTDHIRCILEEETWRCKNGPEAARRDPTSLWRVLVAYPGPCAYGDGEGRCQAHECLGEECDAPGPSLA